jgi:hypothetical protein
LGSRHLKKLARRFTKYDVSGNANCSRTWWHILQNDGVSSNAGVVTDVDWTQHFGSSSHVDMSIKSRHAVAIADSYLLQEQAVWANLSRRVNHYAAGVRHGKTAPKLAVHWHVSRCNNAPKDVAQRGQFPECDA